MDLNRVKEETEAALKALNDLAAEGINNTGKKSGDSAERKVLQLISKDEASRSGLADFFEDEDETPGYCNLPMAYVGTRDWFFAWALIMHNNTFCYLYHRPDRIEASEQNLRSEIRDDGYEDDQEDEAVRLETQR